MPNIIVRSVNGDGFIAHGIDFITRGVVCHSEFVFGDVTFGSRSDDGVKYRPLDVYPVDIRSTIPATDAQYTKLLAFLHAQQGKGYDALGDVGILTDQDWHDDRKWFCSELVTAALEYAEIIKPIHSAVNHITPEDVLIYLSAMFG